jgi:NADPH-dependent 2,4-dienoyl-CoA reductase/sulfur reductase-like enzyme
MAKAVRDKFGKPSIAMGNIRNPQAADDIIARGDADMIGLGRGLIADPDWPNKAKYSDILDIRKCISCNTGCVGNRIGGNRPIRCAINPDLINGEAYRKLKVAKPCNAVVVGGGAVGLDAMEFFAPKGAEVTIVEMMSVIGRDLDASTISAMRECMAKYDVKQMTNTALQIVKPHSFVVKLKDGNREELPFDYGFICLGMRAYAPIWKAIQQGFKGTDTEILNIGDSVRARRIIDGTDAGRHLVLKTLERRVFLL